MISHADKHAVEKVSRRSMFCVAAWVMTANGRLFAARQRQTPACPLACLVVAACRAAGSGAAATRRRQCQR